HDMADLLLPQLLRNRWKAHQRIDLLLGQQPRRFADRMRFEIDLAFRADTHMGSHAGDETMVRGPQRRKADRLTLEIANRVDAFGSKQLEAADMNAAQQHERRRQIQLDDVLRNKPYAEINAVGPYRAMVQVQRDIHVADIGEPLDPQQLLG